MPRSSSPRTLLIEDLRSRFVPVLVGIGFEPVPLPPDPQRERAFERSLPFGYFRRQRGSTVEQVDLDFAPGFEPAFDVGLGSYDRDALAGGSNHVAGEYPVAWLRLHYRVSPRPGHSRPSRMWRASTAMDRETVIRSLLALEPQIEAVFRGEIGPNIAVVDLRDGPPRWFARPFIHLARVLKPLVSGR
jgi:hypothetical protein